jgi:hypothetical protein
LSPLKWCAVFIHSETRESREEGEKNISNLANWVDSHFPESD